MDWFRNLLGASSDEEKAREALQTQLHACMDQLTRLQAEIAERQRQLEEVLRQLQDEQRRAARESLGRGRLEDERERDDVERPID